MKFLMGYIKKYTFKYLMGIIILFLVDLLSLYIPQLTGEITDGLTYGLGDGSFGREDLITNIVMILLVGGGMALGRFGWRYFLFGAARKIEYEMRNDMFEHLSTLSMGYYNKNKTGDLMAHFTNDLGSLRMAIGPAVITAFDAVVMTVMVIFKMIDYVNLKLTLLACVPMLFIMAGTIFYGRAIEKRFSQKQAAFSRLTDETQESISGVRVIKAFVQERKELKAFAKANKNNMDKNMRVVKLQAIVMPLLDFTIGVSSVITLFYGGWLVVHGEITGGQFVSFNQYIGMLVWPMIATGNSITFFSQGAASVRRIRKIMQEEPEIVDDKDALNIDKLDGSIDIDNLSFSYLKELPPVLQNVSVSVEKGSTLAILGKTGSGKTTFANLLLHMYNTESGKIKIDGVDINKIPLKTLHSQIAYVPQDNFLFSDTIQSNIAFGVREAIELPEEKMKIRAFGKKSEQLDDMLDRDLTQRSSKVDAIYNDLPRVEAAAKKAVIHDNIMDFPRQYSTMVGERGVTMSGGQKQRSSIARALMKDSPILILDDALSAVDTDTEETILRNLKEDRAGKTTIIIAHRISTIQNADKIMVLDDGRVAEYGSHEELLKLGGIYCRLYEKQQLEKLIETA